MLAKDGSTRMLVDWCAGEASAQLPGVIEFIGERAVFFIEMTKHPHSCRPIARAGSTASSPTSSWRGEE
jgi:hypothetical protein